MNINYLALYCISAGVFVLLDAVWLGLVAKKLYATELKGLLAKKPKWGAAILFYALYIIGLVYFVITPSLKSGNSANALLAGGLFGLVCYATYDLTNYATIKNFPLKIVTLDMMWGTFVSAAVSAIAYILYTRLV